MTAAGLTEDGKSKYALHCLRHYFASWCINLRDRGGREMPAKAVQKLLGHSSGRLGHLFSSGDARVELAAAE